LKKPTPFERFRSGFLPMDKSLLDTDILSEVIKGIDPTVARNSSAYRRQYGRFTLSTITVVEVIKGFHKKAPGRVDELVKRLANEEALPLDMSAAVLAGKIYADLEKAGQTIGRVDPYYRRRRHLQRARSRDRQHGTL
jgi:tRNA(fMet)-specific endonuclease VapC